MYDFENISSITSLIAVKLITFSTYTKFLREIGVKLTLEDSIKNTKSPIEVSQGFRSLL